MLHLFQLSPHLHEADVDQQSDAANSYAQIERQAAILLLRKRALEDELFAIHNEFHIWAEKYGVELVNETVVSPVDLAVPSLSRGFSDVDLPPNGHVVNTHTCQLSGRFWTESVKYCKIKNAALFTNGAKL